ncbi:hypothetical protein GOBAR_AA08918 [Gossypium barbadense]|uniref:Uncharacterized protein n=1 Tax=Gossypium barbadense TaxID=3634 RepID=A0A2P5Y830_GOSBA|nr:hypothetical protein GOBAR_AA08918 [Gossypium barbadense]
MWYMEAKILLQDYILALAQMVKSNRAASGQVRWQPPPTTYFEVKFDAGFNANLQQTRAGLVEALYGCLAIG